MPRRLNLIIAATSLAILVAGCGGSTTTIIQSVTTVTAPQATSTGATTTGATTSGATTTPTATIPATATPTPSAPPSGVVFQCGSVNANFARAITATTLDCAAAHRIARAWLRANGGNTNSGTVKVDVGVRTVSCNSRFRGQDAEVLCYLLGGGGGSVHFTAGP